MKKQTNKTSMRWYNAEIHIHTQASIDFQQPEITFLEILQRAEIKDIQILAFMDHNTVSGYRKLQEEIDQLVLLEKLSRLLPAEKVKLEEYRRLLNKIYLLPGFEFTATFGFHIISLFSPEKPVREIEHLLLNLNIPPDLLDEGSATVGATTDVITAYRLIKQAGGLTIAAHANSSNGVAMRGFNFGGQTKIAYTQDANLDALEVTDLDIKGPRATAWFFNGTKPEYPRRMHCIQGSDSHRLVVDAQKKKNLGIGDRTTDFLLPELSFAAISDLFKSNDFSRTRPHRQQEEPAFDFIQTALDDGPNIIQDFHESMSPKGGKLYAVVSDICAFANTNGGTLYLGVSHDQHKSPAGIPDIENAASTLEKEINNKISPPLHCTIDINDYKGSKLLRVLIPRGDDPPYAVDDNKIYIRDEAETGLAVRDEIVSLVLRRGNPFLQESTKPISSLDDHQQIQPRVQEVENHQDAAPRTGVEVLPLDIRNGVKYYSMRDLRNGNIVKNVTRSSARRLWHYAIDKYEELNAKPDAHPIEWSGDFGIITRSDQKKVSFYDLVMREGKDYRYFFGVTPNGIHSEWKKLTGMED
ncbi:MAG: transcriptional regulator [Anaerolinea sp.]|nr:transcriptional regulator [Anaerolinea sp.]